MTKNKKLEEKYYKAIEYLMCNKVPKGIEREVEFTNGYKKLIIKSKCFGKPPSYIEIEPKVMQCENGKFIILTSKTKPILLDPYKKEVKFVEIGEKF